MHNYPAALSGQLWTPQGFLAGRLRLRQGKIETVEYGSFEPEEGQLEFNQAYITPGLIDLQINGGLGHDFTAEPDTVAQVAAALPQWGVTAFLPTFITALPETYRSALALLQDYKAADGAAIVLGAHLEGPYLNPAFKGAHEAQYLREPSLPEVNSLLHYQLNGRRALGFMTLAPEEPGALDLIPYLSQHGILVAAGHSGASYEDGMAALEAGLSCGTHLFNAMPPLHHRHPGLAAAILDHPKATANLIVDGIHLHPAVVRLVYRLKGWEHVTLVTDAMAGLGMPPGRYVLAGQAVIVDETSARLDNEAGTLAGSILTLNAAIRNMIEFSGCPVHEAYAMAGLNPACLLGIDAVKGRLQPGFDADIAVFDQNFNSLMTIVAGQAVYLI